VSKPTFAIPQREKGQNSAVREFIDFLSSIDCIKVKTINMGYFRIHGWSAGTLLLLFGSLSAFCQPVPQQFDGGNSTPSTQNLSLPVEQIARKLEEKNAQRAAALEEFSSTRVYHMQYRGFPSDRDAEMVVNVTYRAPNAKQFQVVSQTGSKFVIDRVFKKLLEGEQEAANEENRQHTALSRQNYDFTFAGYEVTPDGPEYILNLLPKTKNKFLYRGKIWVDAKDFAVVRIEGEPARNPSLWIKKTEVRHRYIKVKDFWLPAENHTESLIRLGGRANLWIEYKNYKITKAAPLYSIEGARADSKRADSK
jgi:outer membrane lipoprotein-sorting protein